MGKSKKDVRQTVLFDIRPRSEDKDVILLKGPESEAASVLFSGAIVVSVLEPLTIKKFNLKLFATLKLNWEDKHTTSRGHEYTIPTNFTRILYDFEWDSINLHEFLQNKATVSPLARNFSGGSSGNKLNTLHASSSGFTTGKVTRSNPSSSTSLHSLANSNRPSSANLAKNKSSSNLSSLNLSALTSSSKSDTITLQPGNYEFPFQAFLDGSIPESIEGLPGCSIVYRLQSMIERGRFSTPLVTRRHIHVVRTLTTDAPDLSESVAVDNTWPKKVDYSITVPTRSIAIGSRCNIEFTLVPLLKDLRLGNVKVRLVEYSSFVASTSQHSDERVVLSKIVPKVVVDSDGKNIWKESEMDINGVFFRNETLELAQDKWEIRTFLDIPPSLGKVTQDCDISHYVKVRHKLRFSVGLINPDGHVSELRATLPISLFISPFVPIQAKHLDDFEDIYSKYSNIEDLTVRYKGEEMIFENDLTRALISNSRQPSETQLNTEGTSHDNNSSNTNSNIAPTTNSQVNTQDLMAPPNYENHVYDRIFTDASPVGSPVISAAVSPAVSPTVSGAATPISEGSVAGSNEVLGEFNMTPAETGGKFTSQLINSLSLAARSNATEPQLIRSRNSRPIFSLMGDDTTGTSHSDAGTDYFSLRPHGNGNGVPTSPSANITSKVSFGPSFDTGAPMAQIPSASTLNLPALMSPGTMSPVHLSRVNSYNNDGSLSPGLLSSSAPPAGMWSGGVLSKVPSYETAMKADIASEDLTPAYQPHVNDFTSSSPSNNGINLDLLNSRLENVQLKARAANAGGNYFSSSPTDHHNNSGPSSLSRATASSSVPLNREQIQLTTGLARSRGSSNNSSPAMSRDHSSANLPTMRSVPVSVLSQHLQQYQQQPSQSKSLPSTQPQTPSASSSASTNTYVISAASSNSNGNGSSVTVPSIPRPVHVRTLSGSSVINLARSSSVKSLKSSHTKLKVTGNRSKESLRSSSSALHLHLNLPKKSGSFANLGFLHSGSGSSSKKDKSNGK